ncbi:MAG: GAF domain-containing protein, partial [Deltaproteobacteria bacterium]|nr:GAF domain-containing protein [Deltaproteobacteria bacterium]
MFKITLMAILLAGYCFMIYYFHVIFQSGTVFTHFFYIPIILASLWWKRKGLTVAIFLGLFLIFSHHFLRDYAVTSDDYFRALMFLVIGSVAALVSERIYKSQEKAAHLNAVLHAIRGVNQLITREKNRDRLLQGICETLIKTRGYHNAWIAMLDESGGLVTTAEAGLGKDFLAMDECLKCGELSACCQKALKQLDVVVTKAPFTICTDCPLSAMYTARGTMTIRLEYKGKVYGVLSASLPVDFTGEEEEQFLFKDVAGDIALALHVIELEEKHEL